MAPHSRARHSRMVSAVLAYALLAIWISHADCYIVGPALFSARLIPTRGVSALSAKKGKKKGGKKGDKKQSGFAWAQDFALAPFESSEGRSLSSLLCSSYEMHTGKPLDGNLAGLADVSKALWKITACVLVVTEGPVPVRYANMAALQCFGLAEKDFEGLVGEKGMAVDLPGKMVKKYESGYTKKAWRADTGGGPPHDISLRGASRWALERTVFADGVLSMEAAGVAYTWTEWMEGNEVVDPAGEIQDRVKEQGALIRKLKEEDGLGNKDPDVVKAVEKLLELKAMLPE